MKPLILETQHFGFKTQWPTSLLSFNFYVIENKKVSIGLCVNIKALNLWLKFWQLLIL